MGHGGHHGGGFHGGGHHGSFHGSFHGGGGRHYGGGGYYGGSGDSEVESWEGLKIRIFAYCLLLYVAFLAMLMDEGWSINWLVIVMFCVSFIITYACSGYLSRGSVLNKLKNNDPASFGEAVGRGEKPNLVYMERGLFWVSKIEKKYYIAFYDKNYGAFCRDSVREMILRTPGILWIKSWICVVGVCVGAVINLFFYETVIPIFEQTRMTYEAFNFVDDLVFYFPPLLSLFCSISFLVIEKIKDNLLYKCALRIADEIDSSREKTATEELIKKEMRKKWYYNICPNCGAKAGALKSCVSCGSSLEVKFRQDVSFGVHRISDDADLDD